MELTDELKNLLIDTAKQLKRGLCIAQGGDRLDRTLNDLRPPSSFDEGRMALSV